MRLRTSLILPVLLSVRCCETFLPSISADRPDSQKRMRRGSVGSSGPALAGIPLPEPLATLHQLALHHRRLNERCEQRVRRANLAFRAALAEAAGTKMPLTCSRNGAGSSFSKTSLKSVPTISQLPPVATPVHAALGHEARVPAARNGTGEQAATRIDCVAPHQPKWFL
jgi:hypothetical protein